MSGTREWMPGDEAETEPEMGFGDRVKERGKKGFYGLGIGLIDIALTVAAVVGGLLAVNFWYGGSFGSGLFSWLILIGILGADYALYDYGKKMILAIFYGSGPSASGVGAKLAIAETRGLLSQTEERLAALNEASESYRDKDKEGKATREDLARLIRLRREFEESRDEAGRALDRAAGRRAGGGEDES